MKINMSTSLTKEEKERLEKVAKSERRSQAEVLRNALNIYCERK